MVWHACWYFWLTVLKVDNFYWIFFRSVYLWWHVCDISLSLIIHILFCEILIIYAHNQLQWHHNEHDGFSNHHCLHCLVNCLFRRSSKKTSKFCITGLCEGNSPVTCEFPAQRASNMEYISIWWHHHAILKDVFYDSKSSLCFASAVMYARLCYFEPHYIWMWLYCIIL